MDPDFIVRLQKVSLTEEETSEITIHGSKRNQILEECFLSVLGHFLSNKLSTSEQQKICYDRYGEWETISEL